MNSDDAAAELKRLDHDLKKARQREADARAEASDLHRQGTGLATFMIGRWDDVDGLIPEEFRPPISAPPPLSMISSSPGHTAHKSKQVKHADMVEWCTQILKKHGGGPIHVRQIKEELERDEHGLEWRVPGQGLEGNVGVHLGRAKDVFEPGASKGTWQLVDGGGR